jgi:hypothetical protein
MLFSYFEDAERNLLELCTEIQQIDEASHHSRSWDANTALNLWNTRDRVMLRMGTNSFSAIRPWVTTEFTPGSPRRGTRKPNARADADPQAMRYRRAVNHEPIERRREQGTGP